MAAKRKVHTAAFKPRAAAPGVGLPDPGGGVHEPGALRARAIPTGERGIVWMRAALARISDRAIPPPGTVARTQSEDKAGRPGGEPGDDGSDPHPLGHRAG